MANLNFESKVSQINLSLLNSINSEFKITEANGFASYVNFAPHHDEPVHRWFRYREGYSTQLVKKLIEDLPKGSIILDPFCGCGTTLIAAQELGYESYGFDINPLSTLIAKVKTRSYSDNDVARLHELKKEIESISIASPADKAPLLSIIDKVFHPDVLSALLKVRKYIKSIHEKHLQDFLMVGWLSVLEGVSNVYKEGNGIKYRNRKRTPNGYVTIPDIEWQQNIFPENKFEFCKKRISEKISLMIEDISTRNDNLPPAHIIEDSAEKVASYLHENSTAYIVFSPPYCNCFNYFKIFKIELWMGEFVNSYKDLQALNRRAMRSHVETSMARDYDEDIPFVNDFVSLIDKDKLWDKRIPKAVQGYFVDMKRILNELYKVLKPDGKCVIVVGNSAYSGVLIPTDTLLAKISKEHGFKVDKISVARHLTTSSQQKKILEDRKEYLRESLVILKKQDERTEERKVVYVDELPEKPSLSEKEVYAIKNNGLCNLTHKFHRYPGKFIPHIPRWAISKYVNPQRTNVILDPFCGSGTTLVESMLLGHRAYGLDVDPIARLITKVKTTPISTSRLRKCVDDVKQTINTNKNGKFKPKIPTLSHWFNSDAIKTLSIIREAVESYRNEPDLYDFLLVCFLSIIRRASNADNQTQKTYVSHTYKKKPEPAKKLFFNTIDSYEERLVAFSKSIFNGASSNVLAYTDSRKFSSLWSLDGLPPVDLAITSPPYIKSVDYVYNQMAEYFWVGDLFDMEDQPKQNKHKQNYIGTEKVFKEEYQDLKKTGICSIDEISSKIFSKSPKHAHIVYKYFHDMMEHFREMKKVLSPNGHYIVVVGDSLVSNEPVIVHDLLQDCAHEVGFGVNGVFGYEIRNRHMRFPRKGRGGIVKYDWVIDLNNKG